MRFRFPYPIKPFYLVRGWGVPDSFYEQFGFKRHNGWDLALAPDKVIRAPFSGTVVRVDNSLKGGGVFVSILSDRQYAFDDGTVSFVLLDVLHNESISVKTGDYVTEGQEIALGDNTGLSKGPHAHFQLRRCLVRPGGQYFVGFQDVHLEWVDTNDANNSFDPSPYCTGVYAQVSRNVLLDALLYLWSLVTKAKTDMPPVTPTTPPVPPASRDLIREWALAIQAEESSKPPKPTDRNLRNKNPGNLKWSDLTFSLGASTKDAGGFCIFPSYEVGLDALYEFLKLGCQDKLKAYHGSRTLLAFTKTYAQPPTDDYAKNVAKKLGVEVGTDISTFLT